MFGTKWPTNCDYRPAWAGITATVLDLPIPAKLTGLWSGVYFGEEQEWPKPSWFPELGADIRRSWVIDESLFTSGLKGGHVQIEPEEPILTHEFLDFYGAGYDGPQGYRCWTGLIENPSTGEWIRLHEAEPPYGLSSSVYGWNNRCNYWEVDPLLDFPGYGGWPWDWNVNGWPDVTPWPVFGDQQIPIPGSPILRLYDLQSRPRSWDPS